MTKELEELKKELAKAGSENDVLAALDGFSGELTDEELIEVFGGTYDQESGSHEGRSVSPGDTPNPNCRRIIRKSICESCPCYTDNDTCSIGYDKILPAG